MDLLTGTCDTLVRVLLMPGGQDLVDRTNVVKNEPNPAHNHEFMYQV